MKLSLVCWAPGIESQTMHVHNDSFDRGFTQCSPHKAEPPVFFSCNSVCMHEKGNWRKWTLNSSQGHNGYCFLPSAAKTKWLQMASASADHLLNMNVFFTLRTHTHWKAMPVCICSMCRCSRVRMKMWMQALVWFVGRMNWLICHFTVFHILSGLISVLSEASLMRPWGPFGSLLSC